MRAAIAATVANSSSVKNRGFARHRQALDRSPAGSARSTTACSASPAHRSRDNARLFVVRHPDGPPSDPVRPSPPSARPVKLGGAGSGGPFSTFCRQLRQPPMLRLTPQAWNPTPAKPSSAVRRSHARENQRSRRFGPSAASPAKRRCDRRHGDRQEHEGVMVGAPEVQQARLRRRCRAIRHRSARPSARPAGSPNTRAERAPDVSRTRSE